MRRFSSAFLLFFCAPFLGIVQSFTFTLNGQPTQCGPLSISWTGGRAPFRLIIIIPGFTNANMTIPNSNFRNNKGSFRVPALPVAEKNQLYFAMSDATGAVSGGTSRLMTVGASLTKQICNTTIPANDFFFTAHSTLTQCGDFPFTEYQGAIKPLTIFAFIPGGSDSFVLPFSPPTADSFNWKANISAQTQVAFSMIDSRGRNGGTDILRLVSPSHDKSCLLNTGDAPGQNKGQHSGGLSTGAIVGIVIGGAVVVVILPVLFWWLKRRSKPTRYEGGPIDLAEDFPRSSELPQPMVGHQYTPIPYPSIYTSQAANNPTSPFQPEQPPQRPLPLRLHSQHYDEGSSSSAGSSASGARRTKFVIHRDIDEDEVPIEPPPKYDDRRAPMPGFSSASHLSHDGQPEKR